MLSSNLVWKLSISNLDVYIIMSTKFVLIKRNYNWNFFVFSLTIPIGAWAAAKWFVPFYRGSGEISAYHHLEKRFGSWARVYVVICYLLTQIARAGTIMLGVAIGMHAVTGWDVRAIIFKA